MTARMRFRDLPATTVAGLDPIEDDFTDWVIARAHDHGYLVAHFRPARTAKGYRTPIQGDTGFPDLVLAKPGDLIVSEIKRNGQDPRPDQRAWLVALGALAVVWRPRDAPMVLERLSRSQAAQEPAETRGVGR